MPSFPQSPSVGSEASISTGCSALGIEAGPSSTKLQKLFLIATVICIFLILRWLLHYSHYGIDFTDEGFYLASMARPFNYGGSVTQFGFIYHPLWLVLGGDIVAMRQANILVTFTLACTVVAAVLSLWRPVSRDEVVPRLVTVSGLAVCSLSFFDIWIPTPSYNSLNLQGLLVFGLGLVWSSRDNIRLNVAGSVLIGVGGWLTFMAKPSSAALLPVVVVGQLALAGRLSWRPLTIAGACAAMLMLATSFVLDAGPWGFVQRLMLGLEQARYLGGGHTLGQILRLDEFNVNTRTLVVASLLGASLLSLLVLAQPGPMYRPWLSAALTLLLLAGLAMVTLDGAHRSLKLGKAQGALVFCVAATLVASCLHFGGWRTATGSGRRNMSIAVAFLLLPYVYAFGTNNNYWETGHSASFFWLLSGVVVALLVLGRLAPWHLLLPVALAGQLVTAIALHPSLHQPYRQPQPLRMNSTPVEVGASGSRLVLSEGYAAYLAMATATARAGGLEPNTPMIDLTGQSPGLLYALGADSLGQAWMIGGYPGSIALARFTLGREPCPRLASAWLLIEPDGPLSLPMAALEPFGLDAPGRYMQVGQWSTASGVGGHIAPRIQQLLAPVDTREAAQACESRRATEVGK